MCLENPALKKTVNIVKNLYSHNFDKAELQSLTKNPKFALPSSGTALEDVVAYVASFQQFNDTSKVLLGKHVNSRFNCTLLVSSTKNTLPNTLSDLSKMFKECNNLIIPPVKHMLHVSGPLVPRIHCVPKIHKPEEALRLIVLA